KKIASKIYKNGLLDGEAKEWYPDGIVKSVCYYSNGLLNGNRNHIALTRYHPNGITAETQDFRFGQPLGEHLRYFPNKQINYHATYENWKKEGKEESYFDDGKIEIQGEYSNGKPIGKQIKNHPNGTVKYSAIYSDQGELLEPIKEYYLNGTQKAQ